ncbi:hypothetical protein TWF106_005841 [Orbilia oligospora]|uniref:DUF1014 domain protein n=1 Tax=Orbilia oligospora TaxID=2813651 RepID=A0A6G1M412_ORBOL|nr:hypothetical protein TWF788_009808 [Orbilia oligospora]KAF3209752.1 hypothetical protein TWF679_007291 [Orbilia oligospora]KAF3222063.1 hypothetical protein TWF106_005841 [Orbilia oligospora]KAF3244429.1 hypothetical protein TWF192_007721 [Orbilia oligospora]
MGGKPKAENSKKVAGNARKAEAAAGKQAKADAVKAAKEDAEWAEGSKDGSKKQAAEAKKREAAAKKAARDAELAEETAALKTTKTNPKAGAKGKAAPASRSGGLDAALAGFDNPGSSKSAALNASGIDNALDALSLTSGAASSASIDRHPERRFKAAYAAYEERRMAEGKADGEWDGLRQNQVKDRIRKEFEKSEENPFNQASVSFDASRDEVRAVREREAGKIENRLGDRS